MSNNKNKNEEENSRRLSLRKIQQHSRQVRLGITAIPQLEIDLIEKLKMLSVVRTKAANRMVELRVILDSLELIAVTIKNTGESLKFLLRAIRVVDNTGINFEEKAEQLLRDNPIQESVLTLMESMGGARMIFERTFISLKLKHEAYIRCLRLIKKTETSEYSKSSLSQLVIQIGDYIGASPVNPVFSGVGLCLFTANPVLCAAVVVIVIIALEGEAGGEEEDDDNGGVGDFPQPDPEDDTPV